MWRRLIWFSCVLAVVASVAGVVYLFGFRAYFGFTVEGTFLQRARANLALKRLRMYEDLWAVLRERYNRIVISYEEGAVSLRFDDRKKEILVPFMRPWPRARSDLNGLSFKDDWIGLFSTLFVYARKLQAEGEPEFTGWSNEREKLASIYTESFYRMIAMGPSRLQIDAALAGFRATFGRSMFAYPIGHYRGL